MIRNFFLFILFVIISIKTEAYSKDVKIIKKINNEIITNIDLENEINYLRVLNPKVKDIEKKVFEKFAEDSIVKEKIKIIELKKYYKLDNKVLPEDTLKRFYNNLEINSLDEFENYLLLHDVDIEVVKKKILVEYLWNSLIYNKYNNSLKIDEDEIRKDIQEQIKSGKNKEKKYFLHELIFNIKNKNQLNKKFSEINESIKNIGFENAASLFSNSQTAKIGGKIGWINENKLSNEIKNEIKNLQIGEYTSPIKSFNGYLILYIKDLEEIERKVDINNQVENMIIFKKNEQLKNFSLLYFNKIKINQKIK